MNRATPTVLIGLVFMAGTGCATLRLPGAPISFEEQIARLGMAPEDLIDPDRVTPEMAAWVKQRVPPGQPDLEQLHRLLAALHQRKDLNLRYVGGYTATAEEAFATGDANCLTFSQLIVGLAREIGIPAYYLAVDEVQRYDKEGDLVVVSGHVTAGFGTGPEVQFLEFRVGPDVDYRSARKISDLEALALYYSNRGAELLREGRAGEAREWLATSVRLDPQNPGSWVNLGVALRRTGILSRAEAAYRKAIEISPDFLMAYHNLARLLELRGREDAAWEVLRQLDRRGNRNPFAYLALGDASLTRGDLEQAGRFYRRAVRLADGNAEIEAAMGLWWLEEGRPNEARAWLERAQRLDPAHPRVRELETRLEGRVSSPPPPRDVGIAGERASARQDY